MSYANATRMNLTLKPFTGSERLNVVSKWQPSSSTEANQLLDKVRESQPVPSYLIDLALELTGDL